MLKSRLLDSLYHILPPYRQTNFGYGESGFSWNIRVHIPQAQEIAEAEHLAAYEAWCDANAALVAELISDDCATALDALKQEINVFANKEQGTVGLEQAGRSGGWLLLQRWETDVPDGRGGTYRETYRFDKGPAEADATLRTMSRSTLVKFRALIAHMNANLSEDRRKEVAEWVATCVYEFWQAKASAHMVTG